MTGDRPPGAEPYDPSGDADCRRRLRHLAELGAGEIVTTEGTAGCVDACGLDPRTAALVCLAALVASRATPRAYQRGVDVAFAAGASVDDVVCTLTVVAGTVGLARVVAAAPGLARAAGYDVDRALEDWDHPPASERRPRGGDRPPSD